MSFLAPTVHRWHPFKTNYNLSDKSRFTPQRNLSHLCGFQIGSLRHRRLIFFKSDNLPIIIDHTKLVGRRTNNNSGGKKSRGEKVEKRIFLERK